MTWSGRSRAADPSARLLRPTPPPTPPPDSSADSSVDSYAARLPPSTEKPDPILFVPPLGSQAACFDLRRGKNPMIAPIRTAGQFTGGKVVGGTLKALGGLPAAIVGPAFKATSLSVYLKKPMTLWKHRDDREFLAQVEAVDGMMNSMLAYPGRATLQVYQRLIQNNELVTGKTDVLVPVDVAHAVKNLLPNSPKVVVATAPGGHLGVLTGSSAPATTWAMMDDFFNRQYA